ncbi:uncharacterized protein G2W53_005091 [Senna tora]|uniref:Uncharacterized protein n=1 Tax=Senna tora TaxID=362788 RepID=A0A834XDX1_9FABA|nr:uncharacterized protein G2W53_005091 [Senna tora]
MACWFNVGRNTAKLVGKAIKSEGKLD